MPQLCLALKMCYTCRSSAANNSVQLLTLAHQDIGLSRMLLWWTWKMGMPAVNDVFYPKVTGNEGWAATKSLVQSEAPAC